jgi:putative NADH-flavin reductase
VHERLTVRRGDVRDTDDVAEAVGGHDAVISAVGGLKKGDDRLCVDAARSFGAALRLAGVARILFVGTAGTLEIAPGLQRMDTPDFPDVLKGEAAAQREALTFFRTEADDLEWTYISPPIHIEPGERRGAYRLGTDELLVDDDGESRISIPDYSTALLDELENPRFVRRRFTLAY